VILLLY